MTSPRSSVRLLALARVISLAGGAAAFTALQYYVFDRTHSTLWLAASLFLTMGVAGFVSPIAGMIGDRFDRRRVMIISDLAGAACFALLVGPSDPSLMIAIAFVAALVETPFWSASSAAIPALVGDEDIGWANGLLAASRNVGIMLGPVFGGLLYAAVGPKWVFGANAVSFVLSAAIVYKARGRFKTQAKEGEEDEHKGMKAGFVFLFKDRVLRLIALAWIVLVAGLGLTMVADLPLVKLFHGGPVAYGWLIAAWGGASAFGSLSGRFMNERSEPLFLFYGTLMIAIGTGVVAISPWFWLVILMGVVWGLGDAAGLVAEETLRQRRTPDAVRSRVVAASMAGWQITSAGSLIAGGFVVAWIGPRWVYGLGAIAAAGAALVMIPVMRITRAERAARDAATGSPE